MVISIVVQIIFITWRCYRDYCASSMRKTPPGQRDHNFTSAAQYTCQQRAW
uniref:Uncharacterized protein n=1 Tax=Salmonella sp. TaxID=599 RepID=A0A482ETC0_SALSP|nr:hypothetical protein NNIBIDOC_00018 [Salmonella sp.]